MIDDADACFAAGGPDATLRHVEGAGVNDGLVWTRATDSNRVGNFAQWTLAFAEPGKYRMSVTSAPFAESRRAAYRVRAAGEQHELRLDQTAADGWQTLGELEFASGGDQYVALDDVTGETGDEQLVFDAIRLTRLDVEPPGRVHARSRIGRRGLRGGR